ncbi:hypothetical protein SAMN05661012_04609 [Chitinophaga sancti]|uniref:Uncharacterized protein n=1 Tax=Chitinophaga sancti TaxID=1004 RepID=A0A1K1S1P9_9BACT|nr:hypothetical protein SAMN05661012_04609 [Chitinophaga sancti]
MQLLRYPVPGKMTLMMAVVYALLGDGRMNLRLMEGGVITPGINNK